MLDIIRLQNELSTLPKTEQVLLQSDGIHTDTGFYPNENEFHIPMYDLEYTNSLLEKFQLVRTRFMTLGKKSCYTWHRDPTMRLHIPIEVNDGSFMVIEDEVIRFEVGKVYIVDTTKHHTAVNAFREERTHVVGVLRDGNSKRTWEALDREFHFKLKDIGLRHCYQLET